MENSFTTVLILGALFMYVVPSLVAWKLRHRQWQAIVALNVLAGCTRKAAGLDG